MLPLNAQLYSGRHLKIPDGDKIETKTVLRKCIEARSLLAELNTAGKLFSNQSALINMMTLLEAKDSSQIENTKASIDNLLKYSEFPPMNMDFQTKEVLNYRNSLRYGAKIYRNRALSSNMAKEICSAIQDCAMEIRRTGGAEIINGDDGKALYVPPAGEETVRNLLLSWEKFINEEDQMDPLVRMAFSLYFFEAIRPFMEGNGRTGRILNVFYLMKENLLNLPILNLSRTIARDKDNYYRTFVDVIKGNNWEDWVLYILDKVIEACRWSLQKIDELNELSQEVSEIIKNNRPKIYSKEFSDLIFTYPYCRIPHLVDFGIVKRQSASVYLKNLTDLGILREIKDGRDKIFIHIKLMEKFLN